MEGFEQDVNLRHLWCSGDGGDDGGVLVMVVMMVVFW